LAVLIYCPPNSCLKNAKIESMSEGAGGMGVAVAAGVATLGAGVFVAEAVAEAVGVTVGGGAAVYVGVSVSVGSTVCVGTNVAVAVEVMVGRGLDVLVKAMSRHVGQESAFPVTSRV
jgi:hypothetical protein